MSSGGDIMAISFIGLPYKSHGRDRNGVDCWGAVRLVYEESFGIVLPSYDADYTDSAEASETARVIAENRGDWREVKEPREGDVVLLELSGGQPTHVGVYLDGGRMLHVRRGVDMAVERLGAPFWSRRIVGYFRHRERECES